VQTAAVDQPALQQTSLAHPVKFNLTAQMIQIFAITPLINARAGE